MLAHYPSVSIIYDLRLEKAIAMPIYSVDSIVVCNRNMVGLNSNELAILLVSFVDGYVSPAVTTLP